MRRSLPLLALALCLPGLSLAQDDTWPCWDCLLAISDSSYPAGPEIKTGYWDTSANPTKFLYVWIVYGAAGAVDGLTGIELSIQGLPETAVPPIVVLRDGGTAVGAGIEAPEDPTLPGATGGLNVVWGDCLEGNRVLLEIQLISFDPIPDNTVIHVLPKFPPTNDAMPHALFTMCNFPRYTKVLALGDCFVLNPNGAWGDLVGDPPCSLGYGVPRPWPVTPSTWSNVKALYR